MSGSEAPRPRSARSARLRRRLVAAATERLPYKAAALFLALVLWLVVSAEEPTEDLVPVRLALLVDSTVTLVGERPTVRALVIGRGRELLKLYATPPVVRRVVTADSPDTLVLALRPGDVDVPAGIDAIVRDVQPRALELHFSATAERRVPVRSALRLAAARGVRLVGPPRFSPESVTVVGPRRGMGSLAAVRTVRESVVVADTQPITVPLDTTAVPGRVRPTRVTMVVGVEVDPAARDSLQRDSLARDSLARDSLARDSAGRSRPPAPRARRPASAP